MSRYVFELATLADDAPLCELLAATPIQGRVTVAMARYPSYFAAAAVDGASVQVGVARERDTHRIIGMGSRTLTSRYVNGQPVVTGYLSGLRLLQEFHGQAGLLARGYRFLRSLHQDQRTPFYLTTIAADNEIAIRLLTSARAGLPIYYPCGTFHTLAVSASAGKSAARNHLALRDVDIRPASAADRDDILKFLHEHGPTRQFFPVYQPPDLFSGDGLLKGLQPADILLAHRGGAIVGSLACWDQRPFKQIIVHGYRGWLRPTRPLYNAWAAWRRWPKLPTPGSVLSVRLTAIPVVQSDDACVFRQLLAAMLQRLKERNQRLMLIGLHEDDPLLPIARQYSGHEYLTNLYIVYWSDDAPDVDQLKQRVPYLELGCL